jgi:hypothetical protein
VEGKQEEYWVIIPNIVASLQKLDAVVDID